MRFSFSNRSLIIVSISASLFGFADTSSTHTEVLSTQPTADTVITPNATPVIQHGFDVFITADFIYWMTKLDNIEYAQTGITRESDSSATSSSSDITNNGSFVGPKSKMSPGFKVGIGLDLHHDGWDTYAEYTWFRTHASSNDTFSSHAASVWSYSHQAVFDASTTSIGIASSSWKLHFNNVNWELGRNYFISPKLLLRPHIGLQGTWQHQTYSIEQTSLEDRIASSQINVFDTITTGSYNISQEQHFWGLGIRTGFNTSWQFNRNWSIFGDFSLSNLWGQFSVTRVDTVTQTSSSSLITPATNLTTINTSKRFHTLRPVLECDLGLRWDCWFSDDDYRIRLQAAWEEQIWFDQNQFIQLESVNHYGCLNLQGFTFNFRFDF